MREWLRSAVVRTQAHGPAVLLVTLDRPTVLNAMNGELVRDLNTLLARLHADSGELRCVVVTGAGRAFCAGGDLKERDGQSLAAWSDIHAVSERTALLLQESPIPWIAAVNGACFGGGLELALNCDFIYADEDATFALSECRLGIIPGNLGTQTLPRAVGERRAKELILGAQPFGAAQGAQWGLINRVCSPGTVVELALAAAQRIAGNAPLAVRTAKRVIHEGLQVDLEEAFRRELAGYYPLLETADKAEGVRAFNERRRPNFSGR